VHWARGFAVTAVRSSGGSFPNLRKSLPIMRRFVSANVESNYAMLAPAQSARVVAAEPQK